MRSTRKEQAGAAPRFHARNLFLGPTTDLNSLTLCSGNSSGFTNLFSLLAISFLPSQGCTRKIQENMAFSFGFAGDDIDIDPSTAPTPVAPKPSSAPAFPVPGKPQLPPTSHDLSALLATLPSKIAYDYLDVELDDGTSLKIPRRELWDVRVQLMAEDDGEGCGGDATEGLGTHDVKTGVYEGGFKSWESSVDLVKTLAADAELFAQEQTHPLRVIEVRMHSWFIEPELVGTDNAGIIAGMWDSTAVFGSFPLGDPGCPNTKQAAMLFHRRRLQPYCPPACNIAKLPPFVGIDASRNGRTERCVFYRRRSRVGT